MSELNHLGKQSTRPIDQIDLIDWTGGPIHVRLECAEFSSMCPVTQQPDYGRLTIEYAPAAHLAETKSLKLFLWRYRDRQGFNELLVDEIATTLFDQLNPKWLRVRGAFNPRGGIQVNATAERGDINYRAS
ncbi:MAG: preQ(1) synthase [Phycisphaerales bacterium]|nr:preQ(1) synthase [Phycisphaerales bacterium]